MWVSIIKRLPIDSPPPLLSVFWAVPWVSEKDLKYYCNNCLFVVKIKLTRLDKMRNLNKIDLDTLNIKWHKGLGYFPSNESRVSCGCGDSLPIIQGAELPEIFTEQDSFFGMYSHNEAGAVKIIHAGRDVRVFPDEFKKLSDKELFDRLEAYELVAEDAPASPVINYVLDSDQRVLYEFALLEGADHNQAMIVAAGGVLPGFDGIDDDWNYIPPLGWYRLLSCYQEVFSYEA